MSRFLFTFGILVAISVVACASAPAPQVAEAKPDVDKLLKDLGVSPNFWQKSVVKDYKTKDGWNTWFVSADETPKRLEDGECVGKDFTWVVAVNPATSRGSLYSDDDPNPNPDIGFILNNDVSKGSVACDQIDRKDYFLLDDEIQPHQAMVLIQEMYKAVECIKQGKMQCGKWKKLDVSVYKDDFLNLPTLRIFAIDWDDKDKGIVRIQYMLSPISADRKPYLHAMDCFVKTLSDDSLELEVFEGDYE